MPDLNNLAPYPRCQFCQMGYSPIISSESTERCGTTAELTWECISQDRQLLSCDVRHGKLMGANLMYHGCVNLSDVKQIIREVRESG